MHGVLKDKESQANLHGLIAVSAGFPDSEKKSWVIMQSWWDD
jgi:hypothetical protein